MNHKSRESVISDLQSGDADRVAPYLLGGAYAKAVMNFGGYDRDDVEQLVRLYLWKSELEGVNPEIRYLYVKRRVYDAFRVVLGRRFQKVVANNFTDVSHNVSKTIGCDRDDVKRYLEPEARDESTVVIEDALMLAARKTKIPNAPQVAREYFLNARTLKQAGASVGLGESRASQIITAVKKEFKKVWQSC